MSDRELKSKVFELKIFTLGISNQKLTYIEDRTMSESTRINNESRFLYVNVEPPF